MRPTRGQSLRLRIETADADGYGIATVGTTEVRVAGALPGERVTVSIEAVSRQQPVAWARIDHVNYASPERSAPPCHHAWPTAGTCGGCPLMHMSYSSTLARKRERLQVALGDLFEAPTVRPSPVTLGWRNRTQLLAFRSSSGRLRLGSRAPRGTQLARMDGCRAVESAIRDTADAIAAAAERLGTPVATDTEPGLHGVQVRSGGDDVLVELIARPVEGPWLAALAEAVAALPGVTGVVVSEHDGMSNRVRTRGPRTLHGLDTVRAMLAGIEVSLDATSFFQLNTAVASSLVEQVAAWIGDAPSMIDLYGGTGVFGLSWAQPRADTERPRSVHLVDHTAPALAAAARTAARLGIPLVHHTIDLADADALRGLAVDPATPIVIDPPRAGASDAVVQWLIERPEAPVIYVSCSPRTFARDAERLRQAGRPIAAIEAWDMMPWTSHVELAAHFSPQA